MNEWRVVMRGQQTHPLAIHFNMWTVSSDVSIQRRYCQPPSVHLWAYYTHPTHDVNDVMCEGWPQHRGLRPLLFSNCGVSSFRSAQEPDKCKCCETVPTGFCPYPFADVITKAALSSQLFKDPECWSAGGSNRWPPAQLQTSSLPT